jgi:hypothetical protein
MSGGKSATTTQQVQIPKEVMDRYNAVNRRAEGVAGTPFQPYSYNPSDFVAPLNQTQQAGVNNIGMAQNIAQPFYQAGSALTGMGASSVGRLQPGQINEYLSPYLNNVLGTTMQAQDRQNAIQRNALTGDAIRAGAYGGDRAGIAQANLAYDQNLANSQTIAGILNQGYGQAVQTAQGQQGVQASDLQRMLAAGAQFGQLGSGATQTQLQAGQALLGAGTLGQQTDQAGLSALYNQFLQERGYPFQVAQFLANIAMGTGALSGSTTTTTQPVPFFSDARLKEDISPVGETYDGQQIYKYRMKGDPRPQLGLMAQEVEERRPDAVGLAAGFRTLDYDRATEDAAQMGREGGLAPRRAYAPGGAIAPDDIRMLLEAQKQSFGPFAQAGLYGGDPQQGGAGKPGYVPQASLPVGKLMTAGRAPDPQRSMASEAMRSVDQVSDFGKKASDLWDGGKRGLYGAPEQRDRAGNVASPAKSGLLGGYKGDKYDEGEGWLAFLRTKQAYGGGVAPAYAMGGGVDDEDKDGDGGQPIPAYETPGPGIDIPTDPVDTKSLPKPGQAPDAGKLGLGSQLGQAASLASSLYGAGKAGAALFAMLPFSDRRLKDNIDAVGETYDGQNIYRYDMGDGRRQLGLMAQEVQERHPEAVGERGGYLTLDYDRATQEAVPRAYGGGLVPRAGYAAGGAPDEDYAIRTIAAESSRNPDEMRAVAAVINNRLNSGRWGDNYRDVVLARSQFEPWSDPAGRNYPKNIRDDDPRLAMAREAFAAQRAAEDPTGGAMHFWAPAAQSALGRRPPRWDNDDAVQIGATRFVRGVDGPAREQVMALAPQGGVAGPAQGAITSAAPPSGGLGGGAPQGRQQPPQSQPGRKDQGFFESITPNTFRGGTQSPGQFLSSKQFWVPLLSGLGAMASSNSLFAGSAALQGLGAAAQAYSNLEKREADIDQTKAQTSETASRAGNLSIFQVGNVTYVRLADGRVVTLDKWIETQPPVLGGSQAAEAARRMAIERGLVPDGQAPTGVAPPAAPQVPSLPPPGGGVAGDAPEAAPATGGSATDPATAAGFTPFGPASQAAARDEARLTMGVNTEANREASTRYSNMVQADANVARRQQLIMRELGNNVAKSIAAGGIGEPGAGFAGRAQLVNIVNSVAGVVGLPGITLDDARNRQVLERKVAAVIAGAERGGLGGDSILALQTALSALPDSGMPRDAQATLAADMLVMHRRSIDREIHRNQYSRSGVNTFVQASQAFDQDNADRYTGEKALLKAAISSDADAIVMMNSGKATAAQIEQYFKDVIAPRAGVSYVPGISRYFVEGSRG